MNIGFFAECYDPQINGVVMSMKNLEFELKKHGHNVFKFVPKIGNFIDNEDNVFRQPSIKYFFQPEYNMASLNIKEALSKAKEWNIQIAHAHGEFSLLIIAAKICRRLKIPLVFTFHTMWEYYLHYLLWGLVPKRLARRILASIYKRPDYFIVPSMKVKHYLENTLQVKKPIKIIPTGLKLDHFYNHNMNEKQRMLFRKKYGIKKNDFVLIFVGRVGKEKSIDVIIKGMRTLIKHHHHVKFLIVGDGPAKTKLEIKRKAYGLEKSIIFTGYITWEKIPEAYQASDVFVFASTSETQGLVTVEAMASGLPIVVKHDLAYTDIVKDNVNALIFKDNDEFASKVEKLILNPELCKNMSTNSINLSKNFTLTEFGKKVEKYYEWILQDFQKNEY